MRYVRPLLLILVLLLAGAGALSAFAADQVRTTDTLIYSSDTAVSGAVNAPFAVYVGDNLAGVTNPVKSLSFIISGVYTVGGTLTLTIDSDAATSQAFTLPSVSSPTPFEFVYKDPSGKINPSSAGSYNHTLNLVPSGVTLTTFGVRMSETHRFVPASCPDGSTQKVKTNNFLVISSDSAVSTSRTDSFTLYLGDNMAGIATPLKSLQFTVSGVYTGAGTVKMSLNSDATTEQIFTLPSVSAPTQYEFIYKDPTSSISPTSAGSYNYTITTNPSGVTLYQLGIAVQETHRYAPPACGGLPAHGELYSGVFEATSTTPGASYNSILWEGTVGSGKVGFQLATSDSSSGPWSFYGGDTCQSGDWFYTGPDTPYDFQSSLASCYANWSNKRYYRYAVRICSATNCTDIGATSPIVDDIIINWSP